MFDVRDIKYLEQCFWMDFSLKKLSNSLKLIL